MIRNPLIQGLVLLALHFLAGRLGIEIRLRSGPSSYIWLPSGIALAALVLLGRKFWPWIFISAFLLDLTGAHTVTASLLLASANALESWLSAFLLTRFISSRPSLTRVREVVLFFGLVMGLGVALGSAVEVTSICVTGEISGSSFFIVWRTWWLAEAVGDLVIGGFLICWWNDIRFRISGVLHSKKIEVCVLSAALIACGICIYTPLALQVHSLIVRPYLLFTLMAWSALRFDVFGAFWASFLIALISVYGELNGYVPPAPVPRDQLVLLQQFFILSWGSVGLILSAAIREKQEAVEAMNEFLGIASHELRTPLTSLSLQLEIFKMKSQGFELMERQVCRLINIVEQLLDVSRIGVKYLQISRSRVDLSILVNSTLDRLAADLKGAGCEIQLDLETGVFGNWDAFRIEQVLENLVSNAIKYAPKSPIRISISNNGGWAEFSIKDHGPGIAEDLQKRIFDRFVRADSTFHVKGLGLGLFITRRIVEAHDGEIAVMSKPGSGSAFTVRLPACTATVD